MAKKKRKQTQTPHNCENCGNCLYICEGDYICDNIYEIVITDFSIPTEHYMHCNGADYTPE